MQVHVTEMRDLAKDARPSQPHLYAKLHLGLVFFAPGQPVSSISLLDNTNSMHDVGDTFDVSLAKCLVGCVSF
jgi:hypothetical protein